MPKIIDSNMINSNSYIQNKYNCKNRFKIIFSNIFCYKCYNNSLFIHYKNLIKCYNEILSGIILISFSIYMSIISIIVTMNINHIEYILDKSDNYLLANLTTRQSSFLGFNQGYYDITYEDAKILKIFSTIFNVLICLFSISLPLCSILCIKYCRCMPIFNTIIAIIGYIISYILINIQYHIILALNIITSYTTMIIIHIFTFITMLYSLYLVGYYINTINR